MTSGAHADPLSKMSGKIIQVTRPDRSRAVMEIGPSGTWEMSDADGRSTSGTYYWQSDRTICFLRQEPMPVLNETGRSCMLATFDAKREMVTSLTAPDGRVTTLVISTTR
jgi:hypothetical protein